MAIQSIRNQYPGINAHLHSYWQAEGGWPEFHSRYIIHLTDTLKPLLLKMGYTAAVESSLQIRRLDWPGDVTAPESDITLYDRDPLRAGKAVTNPTPTGTGELVMPLREGLNMLSENTFSAIKVYDRRSREGEPVAWFELLSPSNKGSTSDARAYLSKRQTILESGIVVVEIDFLHETPPTLPRLRQQPPDERHPYHILVGDPRPSIEDGIWRVIGFDVDSPIPSVKLRLNADDLLVCDFNSPYHRTLAEALYGLERVDYGLWPLNLDRYTAADQGRIANRMLAIQQAVHDGLDLETGPFPVKVLPLEAARAALNKFHAS